jgi:hypothetical protein
VESKSFQRIDHKTTDATKAGAEDGFYFGIDMGPYWYEPLGRVFAMSQREIETEALKVIRKELNYLSKGAWDEDERERRKLTAPPLYQQNSSFRHRCNSLPEKAFCVCRL